MNPPEISRRHVQKTAITTFLLVATAPLLAADTFHIEETDQRILIETPELEAVINKQGYVSGVFRQSFLDKKTGFRDVGSGVHIVDWILEPGSDESYRDQLGADLVYQFGNLVHGPTPKRLIEGPQICTQAKRLEPEVIRGKDFVAIKQQFRYHLAAPGKQTGSLWTQWLVFPRGKRYFISMDRIDAVNDSDAMTLRIDMPGHIRHRQGDTFEKVYLSYHGEIGSQEFLENFSPAEKFNYQRDRDDIPARFIRAYQLRNPTTGERGPWLAGMTLEPSVVSEAWSHQRGYVCMIQEFGGRPVKAGESFAAAFVVGYFDSIAEMESVYDQYRGHTQLEVTADQWRLVP